MVIGLAGQRAIDFMSERFKAALDVDLGDDNLPTVRYTGRGSLPSRYAVSDLAAECFGRAGAWLARYRDGQGARDTHVEVDRVLASRWFAWSLRPVGWQTPSAWDALAGDYRCADGWIRLHTNAPVHRHAALQALGLADGVDRDTVTDAVRTWAGQALEVAVVAGGGCAAQLHQPEQWYSHSQGLQVQNQPLVLHEQAETIVSKGVSALDRARPLAGVKVLDLTRVLAGPVAGRFLAGYGANVLRIDPPGWDEPGVIPEVTLGKRCAGLDLRDGDDRAVFANLLRDCDVLLHGYRPGALGALGFDEHWRREKNPHLVDVSLSAYGWRGPWAGRRGFDSLVQMSTGIAWPDEPGGLPKPMPVQALDHGTGYLMAAAAMRGLTMVREQGVGCTSRLSLAGTAAMLCAAADNLDSCPMPDETDSDISPVDEHTEWGLARRLRFPLSIEACDAHWSIPAGSLRRDPAQW